MTWKRFVTCRRLAVAALVASFGLGPAAIAKENDLSAASRAFDEGLAAFDGDRFREAASAFERAFALSGHPFAAFNAALAWREVPGAREKEADALWLSLSKPGLEPAISSRASARLAELRRDLAFVEVDGPRGATITIANDEPRPLPARFHLEPQRVVVEARGPDGRRVVRTLDVRPGATTTLDLAAALAAPPTAPAEPAPDDSVLPILGWVGIGLGTALGGTAVGLGVATLEARDEFDAGGQRSQALHDRAVDFRAATNGVAFTAGALALGGAIVLIVAAIDDDDAQPPTDGGGWTVRF